MFNIDTVFTSDDFAVLIDKIYKVDFKFATSLNKDNSKFFGKRKCGLNQVVTHIVGNSDNYDIYVSKFTLVNNPDDVHYKRYLEWLEEDSKRETNHASKTIKAIQVNSKKDKDIWNKRQLPQIQQTLLKCNEVSQPVSQIINIKELREKQEKNLDILNRLEVIQKTLEDKIEERESFKTSIKALSLSIRELKEEQESLTSSLL
jgi:hypothetical protein